MEANDVELGPIDIVVIGYPADAPMTGEAAPLLLDLVDRGIIRVLDVLSVVKNKDGTFSGFDAKDLDSKSVGDLTVFEGASSGLARRRGRLDRRRGDRARHCGHHDHVREPLGRAVCCRGAAQRRGADRVPAHRGPGADRLTRRRRGGVLNELSAPPRRRPERTLAPPRRRPERTLTPQRRRP